MTWYSPTRVHSTGVMELLQFGTNTFLQFDLQDVKKSVSAGSSLANKPRVCGEKIKSQKRTNRYKCCQSTLSTKYSKVSSQWVSEDVMGQKKHTDELFKVSMANSLNPTRRWISSPASLATFSRQGTGTSHSGASMASSSPSKSRK